MITNEYGLEERQHKLLELAKDVDKIMRKNGIVYSLCGGTLLGAIRHDGFIPWDDDLDIMLDRENYEKLIRLFKGGAGTVKIRGVGEDGKENVREYVLRRKLWVYSIHRKDVTDSSGNLIFTDVFVMDNCPDNNAVRKAKVFAVKTLQGMMHESLEPEGKSLGGKVLLAGTYVLGRFFPDRVKFRMYENVSQIGNKSKTEYITGYYDLFKLLNCRYTGRLFDNIIYHKFEDTKLPIIAEYDNYLTVQYGDYMTPPDTKERIPMHQEDHSDLYR